MQKADEGSAFRRLVVWQKAMSVTKSIYLLASSLPKEELFGLGNQMRRCAISIPSNIAEGAKRGKKEFRQFLRIANGSAAELETQLLLSYELHAVPVDTAVHELREVQRMLESLIQKL